MRVIVNHPALIVFYLFSCILETMAGFGGKDKHKSNNQPVYAQPYAAPSGHYQSQYPSTAYPHHPYPPAGYLHQPAYPQYHSGSSSSTSHMLQTGAAAAVGAAVGTAAVGGAQHAAHKLHRKMNQAGHLLGRVVGAAVRPPHVPHLHVPHVGHIPGLHLRPPGPHGHGPRPRP